MELQFHPDPENGQRNRPKHVQFQSQNKFEKLVHLVGFITFPVSAFMKGLMMARNYSRNM
jgi:hypothetical protein